MKILTSQFSDQAPSTPAKYCVFSHFDANDRVERYVLYYLEQLKRCGYEAVSYTHLTLPTKRIV